jgi:hypothetical protein
MSVSRIPVPTAPGRIARTEQERQSFEAELKAKEAVANPILGSFSDRYALVCRRVNALGNVNG